MNLERCCAVIQRLGLTQVGAGELCRIVTVIGSVLLWSFALDWPAIADDIAIQVGRSFSLFAPSSCRKIEQESFAPSFALVLDCNFRSKQALFYMKEFPGQLDMEFDPRANPPTKLNREAYLNTALRAIVDEFDPGMSQRIRFFSSGSLTGEDVDARLWEEGLLSSSETSNDLERIGKCVFLSVQTYRRGGSAVLFAVSEVDGFSRENGPWRCVGVPGEVWTILSSLSANTEGGRFEAIRKGQKPSNSGPGGK